MDKQSTTSQANPPEPVNCGSRKPLKDWTLGEVKEHCIGRECDDCIFDTGIERERCLFRYTNPTGWDLTENPRFTEEEVECAKAILVIIPESRFYEREQDPNNAYLNILDESDRLVFKINVDRFPSILPGQRGTLSDIVGGEAE